MKRTVKQLEGELHRTMMPTAVAVLLAALLACTACAVPYRVGYAPKNAEEGYVAQTIQAMVEALNSADVDRFMSKVSTGYYGGYTQLEERVKTGLQDRLQYELQVTINDIVLEEPKVAASVSWKSSWMSRTKKVMEKDEGTAQFFFMKGMGIKLINNSGDTLFAF